MGMEKHLDAETLRYILANGQDAKRVGLAEPSKPRRRKDRSIAFVQPGIAVEPNRITIMIAVETKAEVNQRAWKAKNRRAGEAWRRTREAIGPHLGALEPFARHYADGGALRVGFVRLGGRRLDVMSNLGSALKGVEDAVAYLLGASDGSPQWHAAAGQEPGGGLVGVRVTVEAL